MGKRRKKTRPGPKRIVTAREPNGRRSRTDPETLRDAMSPAQVVRIRDEIAKRARDPTWGFALGTAYLDGKITSSEFSAGKRLDELIAAHRLATSAPSPHPKTSSLEFVGTTTPPDPDSEAGRKDSAKSIKIMSEFKEVRETLTDCGKRVEEDVRAFCDGRGERPTTYEAWLRIKCGLAALVRFWRLTNAS